MFGRAHVGRDPFEGTGAYRRNLRVRVEGGIAFTLALIACGLTAAVWLRALAPVFEQAF
jgi:hypothetical protein